jgi:YHS domain-containing protein
MRVVDASTIRVPSTGAAMSRLLVLRAARTVLTGVFLSAGALSAQSMSTPTRAVHVNTTTEGVALKGYDPVAYFTASAPTPGVPAISATVEGVTYRFASEANKRAFVADPSRYLPQYGGYCAMGMAGGRKFDIDPTAWRVEAGKLYLNKDPATQRVWLRDVPGNIRKADAKWPAVIAKP